MSSVGEAPPTPSQHLVAGTLGGLVSTVGLYPLELIKTRMQVVEVALASAQPTLPLGGGEGRAAVAAASIGTAGQAAQAAPRAGPYASISSALRVVLEREGWRGLYLGLTPAVIASAGSWGGYFFFYELAKNRRQQARPGPLGTVDHLLSGVEAGSILVLLFNPLWLVKTRLAIQGADARHIDPSAAGQQPKVPYKGMMDALRTIVREEGPAGLYRGVVPALFLTSHGAIQFAVYEWLKKIATVSNSSTPQAQPPPGGQSAWVSVLSGGTAKIVASTVTYPYQVIKSRLQQREATVLSSVGPPGRLRRYRGMVDCIVKIWRVEGPRGYFRGVVPNALKVAPSAALTFVVYEEVLKLRIP